MRELLVLRHAHAESPADAGRDSERALTGQGRSDALAQAGWLRERDLVPDRVICSPAARARQTAELVAEHLGFDRRRIETAPAVYEARPGDLIRVLEEHPGERVLLVGHNPGISDLVRVLSGRFAMLSPGGLAHLVFDEDGHPEPESAQLVTIKEVG